METAKLRERVINELSLIPQDKLIEVYDVIHFFRMGLEKSKTDADKILSFSGCWGDMQDKEFNEFTEEIKQRRKQAFKGRQKEI